jgi:hypothetical protein
MVVVNNMLLDYYWPHVICSLPRVAEGDGGGEQRAAGLLLASSGNPRCCSLHFILRRVPEWNGGGEQHAAGPLMADCGTLGDALYLLYCAGWQKGMVVVNNVLLGRYWPRVGTQEMLFTCYTAQDG